MTPTERRAFRRFAIAMPLANLAGAVDLFLSFRYVLPVPSVANVGEVRMANVIAFAILIPATLVMGNLWGTLLSLPTIRWLESGRPPNERQLQKILHLPLSQLKLSATLWGFSAAVFGVLNATYSLSLGALLAGTILLGGMTTCAVVYLLAERLLRPITTRALAAGAPARPALPGVSARVLLAWAFTTAVPVLGAVVLAATVAAGASISAQRVAVSVLFFGVAALTTGVLAMKLTARSVADPLRTMRLALGEVERGRLDVEVPVEDGSEVGLVQAGFNRMVAGLREHERLRDLFGRHVGEEVAREALARGVQLGGEVRHAAALFVDLVGSTALATQRSPAEVVALLNRFFSLVVEVVRAEGGLVNKFEGDGALCLFGAPVAVDDPMGGALRAARRLDARLRAELPELRAGIGVSAGPVVAGNVGAAERFEYTVIGDPVNEAARLMELAKDTPGRVVASADVLAAIDDGERSHWRSDGTAVLRGRSQPTGLAVPTAEAAVADVAGARR